MPPADSENESGDVDIAMSRLVALGKLWVDVALFHPYLGYRVIDWNEALVDALAALEADKSDVGYLEAVNGMLSKLQDPLTYACFKEDYGPMERPALVPRTLFSMRETVAVFDLKLLMTEEVSEIKKELLERFDQLSSASAVLFDLREQCWADLEAIFDNDVTQWLTKNWITAPSYRSRQHFGFASTNDDYFYSAFVTRDARGFYAGENHLLIPIYFLIDGSSRLPAVALALHSSTNEGAIICDGEAELFDIVAAISTVKLPGNIEVRIRLEELVFADGRTGFYADKILLRSEGEDLEAGLLRALEWINSGSGTGTDGHPTRIDGRYTYSTGVIIPPDFMPGTYPDRHWRLLSAFHIWSVINYFFPYKNLMEEDWEQILVRSLVSFEQADSADQYALAVSAMLKHLHDSHVAVAGEEHDKFFGLASPALQCRIVEEKFVITKIEDGSLLSSADVKIGDIIIAVDGKSASERRTELEKYICASNVHSLDRKVSIVFLNGLDGSLANITVEDSQGEVKTIALPRRYVDGEQGQQSKDAIVFVIESENLGYANLDKLTRDMVPEMFEMFKNTRGIIFDMRGYPENTMIDVAERLCLKERIFTAKFSRPVVACPLSNYRGYDALEPQIQSFMQYLVRSPLWCYVGKTVMLIDASAQSQAEHTGMYLQAANGTVLIGSPSAGANGTVNDFKIPGEMTVSFSGDAIEYADGRQLQRLGLQPDVWVQPTIAGIKAGKDEILDAAIEFLR